MPQARRSSPTFYKRKGKYGRPGVSKARRLKLLTDESAKLKRMLADAVLDNAALKDLLEKMVTSAACRKAAAYLRSTHGMSERRACGVLDIDRTSVCYAVRRPDDGALRERLKAVTRERRRFGYRLLHALLRREEHAVYKRRVQRLHQEEKRTVRRPGGRKRTLGERRPMETPLVASERWSLDFVSDQMTDRRRCLRFDGELHPVGQPSNQVHLRHSDAELVSPFPERIVQRNVV